MAQGWRGWLNFSGVLEWSAVDKGILLPVLVLPLYFQYVVWAAYVLFLREDRAQLVDEVYLWGQFDIFIGFIVAGFLLVGLGFFLRRRWPNAVWFQFLSANFYSLTLVYCGYIIGTQSFAAGVVLVGAPLIGFILLKRWVTYVAWFVALAAIILLSYAAAIGLLQYAPALVPPQPGDPTNQLFWITSTFYFAAPHIAIILLLADFTLARWRERELAFRTLSFTDVLTGAHNRRSILGMVERELARRHRMGPAVSVVILDLDHFKRINDTWGHPTGDAVLQHTAKVLDECLRQSDALGRYGGEEFMLVLPDTDLNGAAVIAERCRQKLEQTTMIAGNGDTVPLSASFGVASNARDPETGLDALILSADAALYRAKEAGRNRVELAV